MPSIGSLKRRLTLIRWVRTGTTPGGTPIGDWEPVATVWAARTDISDSEKMAGYGPVSTLISRFVVRDTDTSRDFTVNDRLRHDGRDWDITGIKETRDGVGRFLEITTRVRL